MSDAHNLSDADRLHARNDSHDEDVRLVRYATATLNANDAFDRILTRYDALMEEHEAWRQSVRWLRGSHDAALEEIIAAHDKVEELISKKKES